MKESGVSDWIGVIALAAFGVAMWIGLILTWLGVRL
jgi:hypothetical protein